jgi:hypothetical protein
MRLVPGENLRRIIDSGPLDLRLVGRVVARVADALDAAHELGLVHRDVTPANILLSGAAGQEHVYLTDFGLTKRLGSSSGLTRTGSWVGTPDYVAPEQIRGHAVDGRADVYSLGCVLYEMLAGRVPYPRDSHMAKLWAHVTDPPPLPRRERPDLVEAFDEVVARATAKEPADRYATAGELATALEDAISQQEAKLSRAAAQQTAPRKAAPARPTAATAGSEPSPPAATPAAAGAGRSAQPHKLPPASPGDRTRPPTPPPRSTATAAAPSPAPAGPPRRPQRRRALLWSLAAAGVVLAGLAAVVLIVETGQGRAPATVFPVGGGPDGIAEGAGAVWVAASRAGQLIRIDPRSGATSSVPVGPNPDSVVVAFNSVWVSVSGTDQVKRVSDGQQPKVVATVHVGARPEGIAASQHAIWVANSGDGTLTQIKATTNVPRTVPDVGRSPVDVDIGADAVWAADSSGRALAKVNGGRLRRVATITGIGPNPRGVAVVGRDVWVVTAGDGRVSRVDGDTNIRERSVWVGGSPRGITTDGRHLWVSDYARDRVVEIDPAAMRVVRNWAVGRGPIGLEVDRRALWVAGFEDGQVRRIPR